MPDQQPNNLPKDRAPTPQDKERAARQTNEESDRPPDGGGLGGQAAVKTGRAARRGQSGTAPNAPIDVPTPEEAVEKGRPSAAPPRPERPASP